MKEYIVHAPNDNKTAVEEYASFYGEPITELIRCKDCEHYSAFHMDCYRISNVHPHKDDYCSWAKRRDAVTMTAGRSKAKNAAEGKKAYTANATVFKVRKEDEPE